MARRRKSGSQQLLAIFPVCLAMPRSLSPTFLAQLGSTGSSQPVLFVVLAFADQTLYLFNGIGSFVAAGSPYSPLSTFPYGQTFTGVGWLGKLSSIPQTSKVQAQGITLALSGIPSALVNEAVAQVRITGTATVYLGFFNPSTGALIPDPLQLFAGALDVPTLDDSGATSTLSITAENPLLQLNEAPNRQFDDMDQQIYFPGDLGLSFLGALGNLALFWPAPVANASVFAVDFILTPNGADIGVGDTLQMSATLNYSDTSYYTITGSGHSGSGAAWIGGISSSNPKIATVNENGLVTGISPGICLIIVRAVYPYGTPAPASEKRVACTVIVSSGAAPGNLLMGASTSTPGGVRQISTASNLISQYPITSSDSVWTANGGTIVLSGGMCVDASGNMYIFDAGGSAIYKVPFASGVAVRIAGTGTAGHSGDGGAATSAQIASTSTGIAVDAAGNVYYCDYQYVRAINMQPTTQTLLGVSIPAGCIAGVAGIWNSGGYTGDSGAATLAHLNTPCGVAFDSAGNLYVADSNNNAVRQVTTAGIINTFIGGGGPDIAGHSTQHSGDGGSYLTAQICAPTALCFDANENLYIFCANTGNSFSSGGSPIGNVLLYSSVTQVAAAVGVYPSVSTAYTATAVVGGIPAGNLAGGMLNVVGLTGTPGVADNGEYELWPGAGSSGFALQNPYGAVLTGGAGAAYAEGAIPTIRVINLSATTQVCCGISIPAGAINSVAGLHYAGFSGDGGSALFAQLGLNTYGIAVDGVGNLYIADISNKRIRMVNAAGTISTYAGNGTNANTGNGGPPGAAEVRVWEGLCFVLS
jgi:sugar lactone lactonase YvrE